MWVPNLFIFELLSINALSASSILVREVTALSHEAFDDSVEEVALVGQVIAFLACAESSEVFSGLGHFF